MVRMADESLESNDKYGRDKDVLVFSNHINAGEKEFIYLNDYDVII